MGVRARVRACVRVRTRNSYRRKADKPGLFRLSPDLDLAQPGFGAVGGGGRAFSEPERECRIPSSDPAETATISDVIKSRRRAKLPENYQNEQFRCLLYQQTIYLSHECFHRHSFQPVNCNITGTVQCLHDTVTKLAYCRFVYSK